MKAYLIILVLALGVFAQDGGTIELMSGRVTSDSGVGLPSIAVTTMTEPGLCEFSWTGTTAHTNLLGYYSEWVHSDCSFVINPHGKGYSFTPSIWIPGASLNDVDFAADAD